MLESLFNKVAGFMKKGVLKEFTKLTAKHLCHGLYFNKVVGLVKKVFFKVS